jgi:DsbC/DsbD-like thiol-disulfide interchange protein
MHDAIPFVFAALLIQAAGSSPLLPPGGVPKHLTLATSTSAASAAPGSRVSLFADVTPNRGIHVYAPGAEDFLPIALKLEPSAGAAIGAVVYPKSETMEFDGQKVPVFQKPFRLATEMTIAPAAKAGTTLTIRGTIRYQACDDRVCFIPASAPVSWTIAVK